VATAGRGKHADQLQGLLVRGRLLLFQGVASTFADRLSGALVEHAREADGGDSLRRAIDRIRVGVITDSTGAVYQQDRR
jgi:hypothetical protein